jgi:Calcineurin-like phosphoesterase
MAGEHHDPRGAEGEPAGGAAGGGRARRRLVLPAAALALVGGALAVVVVASGGSDASAERPPDAREMAFGVSGAPALSRRAVVWAVGDGADGGGSGRAVAARIAAGRPTHFLYLGDVYEDGTAEEFARHYRPVYGHLDAVTAPTPGNHEWSNAREGYNAYWDRVRGRPMPSYYSFHAGGWELLSLNSEVPHDEGSRQLRWLRDELAERGTCRLAFLHRPRFSAGRHGDQAHVAPLWRALRGRAAVVVAGHDHNMQRLRPIDRITQFVSGAGGKSHYGLDERDPRLAFADERANGALRLELEPGVARHAFVSASGRVLDAGEVRCSV